MNDATRLLRRVADNGGVLPSAAEVRALLHFGTKNDRDTAYAGIMIAAKRVKAILADSRDSGQNPPGAVDDVIADAAEKFAGVVGLDNGYDGPSSGRNNAAAIKTNTGAGDRDVRIAAARTAKRTREPLRELLALSGPGKGLNIHELGKIALRADLSADQVAKFRADVQRAADRIQKLYAQGNHAGSRAVAEEVAVRLSDSLAGPADHVDPHRDVEDPRALADAIRGKSA